MIAQYIYEKIKKRVPMEGDLKGSEYTVMGSESRNLLIVACSKRKHFDSSLLPALERYDGSTFRIIRRFLRSKPPEVPDIYILSAEFGLISSEQMIPYYFQKYGATTQSLE